MDVRHPFPFLIILLLSTFTFAADYEKGLVAADNGDYATALKEWEPLAEQGDVKAQFNLGQMYRQGQGVTQDYQAALKWVKLAAQQGDTAAQNNLGYMYANGLVSTQDYIRAYMWWDIAASKGNKYSERGRAAVLKLMTPAQIAEAQELARECVAKVYKGC